MSYDRSLADDFLREPDSLITQIEELQNAKQAAEDRTNASEGGNQSSPNPSNQPDDGTGAKHAMTALYILIAIVATFAIYQDYKSNSLNKPPLYKEDGTLNVDRFLKSPAFKTGKNISTWVAIFLGVAVLLWGWNKLMVQVRNLEKNTFASNP